MNSQEDKKISDEKSEEQEEISKQEDEQASPEKKDNLIPKDERKEKKLLAGLNEKSWADKFSAPLEFLGSLAEEISLSYVAKIAGGVLFCVLIIGAVLIFADPFTTEPVKKISAQPEDEIIEKRIHIKIREGMSTGEIADELESKEVITSSLKFRFLSRLRDYDGKMKPGTYVFTTGMTDEEVFNKILNGEKHLVTFTIPEGFGVKDIADRLYEIDLVDKEDFLKAAENFLPYPYTSKRKNVIYAAEGFLFPDTYAVESDATIEEILKLMSDEFEQKITPEIREKAHKMNLSVYDLITLASIVEREVRYPEDRPIVAQVFFKRLKLNMPLQTDATLQYLMDTPKEDLSIEDTKIDSPYNTYQHAGLPPGPIASPGMESIEAVLNPADTDYLYFVADRQGHNHYSDNYEEHLQLVNQYR